MCLAVPHTIEEIMSGNRAVAVTGAVRMESAPICWRTPAPGDTVLVHAGFAIEKLSGEDAEELKNLWGELRALAGDPYAH